VNKGLVIIGLGLVVIILVLGSWHYQSSDSSEGYKPGDVIHIRIPSTGTMYQLTGEPSYMRYHLKNPIGDTIHVEDHEITYKKDEPLGWTCYDEHQITIGAFPMAGLWKLEGELHSVTLGIIDIGSIPTTKEFYVAGGTIIDNLFAPLYFHGENPLSFIFGTIDITIPPLIYPIAGIVLLIALIAVYLNRRDTKIIKMVKKHSK